MPVKLTPAERLKRIAEAMPQVTELAGAVSLCVRAEPELVRTLRFTLFPRSGAWLEADLYFSPFVGQRTPDWIVLEVGLAHELRERLARRIRTDGDQRRTTSRVRHAIERAHSHVPLEIRQEEEVLALAVERRGGVRRTRAEIDRRLRPLLNRLLASPQESVVVARWFASAARRMPLLATKTEAFRLLAFAASSVLGGRRIDPRVNATAETFAELSQYLPTSVKRRPLWVALTSRGVRYAFAASPGHHRIDVPRTDPVLLEVRSGESPARLLQLTPGPPSFTPLPSSEATIRTLSRDVFRLRALASQKPATSTTANIEADAHLEHDVFISYASADAEWIRQFADDLRSQLRVQQGSDVSIFLDADITREQNWDAAIQSAIRRSGVFIAAVSPSYLNSKFALRELEAFEAAARQHSYGLDNESFSRVIPIMLMPVDRAALPFALRSVIGFEFFTVDDAMGTFRQFEPRTARYERRINDLAQSIVKVLHRARDSERPVYVAATDDLAPYLGRLKRELQARAYSTTEEFGEISGWAQACILLLGKVPSDDVIERIVVLLQDRSDIRVFVWMPNQVETSNRVLDNLNGRQNVEMLLGVGFDRFFESVVEGLRAPTKQAHVPTISLVAYSEDLRYADALLSRLRPTLRLAVIAVQRSADEPPTRMSARSDGVIVCWGIAPASVVERVIAEARQSDQQVVVYLGPPDTREKVNLRAAAGVTIVDSRQPLDTAVQQILEIFAGPNRPPV